MSIEALYQIYLQHPHVQTDTRKLQQGDLFFALRGPNFNANSFAHKALELGAAYAVIDDAAFEINERTILVDDVLQTLQQLALHHRQQLTIPVLAITGSNGKTTTKELIHAVLSSQFTTYTTEGNLNNHIGVPLTLLKIEKNAEMAVIEMGANHLGEIASYCSIALPTHGLITNCGKAHLEGFGSVEGVKKGKGELFDHLRTNEGTAFVLWDHEYLQQMSAGIKSVIKYGTQEGFVTGQSLPSNTFLKVAFENGLQGTVETKLVGAFNLPNVLAAAAVGKHFGVADQKILNSIETYSPSNSRSQLLEKGSNKIILDAYNANPSSMKLAIQNFAQLPADKKVIVIGAMAELGAGSLSEHQAIVEEIKRNEWQEVVLVGGDFLQLPHPYRSLRSAKEAGEWLQQKEIKDAYILLKGSRSTGMEKVLEYL